MILLSGFYFSFLGILNEIQAGNMCLTSRQSFYILLMKEMKRTGRKRLNDLSIKWKDFYKKCICTGRSDGIAESDQRWSNSSRCCDAWKSQ